MTEKRAEVLNRVLDALCSDRNIAEALERAGQVNPGRMALAQMIDALVELLEQHGARIAWAPELGEDAVLNTLGFGAADNDTSSGPNRGPETTRH